MSFTNGESHIDSGRRTIIPISPSLFHISNTSIDWIRLDFLYGFGFLRNHHRQHLLFQIRCLASHIPSRLIHPNQTSFTFLPEQFIQHSLPLCTTTLFHVEPSFDPCFCHPKGCQHLFNHITNSSHKITLNSLLGTRVKKSRSTLRSPFMLLRPPHRS